MSDMIKQGWLYWKLVIFKLGNGFFIATATVFIAATDGVDISAFSYWQKVRLGIFCLLAGGKFLEAFLDQTTARMARGKPALPMGDDDTQTITRTDVQQTTIHTSQPAVEPPKGP